MRPLRRRTARQAPLETPVVDRWAHIPAPPIPDETRLEHSGEVPDHGLVRPVWTEGDFASLGWHDASLWAFEVQHGEDLDDESTPWSGDRVALDLDYITRWVEPQRPSHSFTFWVAPCTLVFIGVTELELSLSAHSSGPREIADMHAVRGGWHIAGHDGFDMKVAATGFTQTFRQRPVQQDRQVLDIAGRGGYSYSGTPATL